MDHIDMEVKILNFIKKHKILTGILLLFSIYVFVNYTRVVDYEKNLDTKDKHYINELYKSDDRIYNTKLNPPVQKMYDLILNKAKNHIGIVNIDLEEFGCSSYSVCGNYITLATHALFVDHPELMNFAGYTWIYKDGKLTLSIKFSYLLPFKDMIGVLRIEKIIADIKEETKNMTEKEKIIYVYDWMGKHNYYDKMFMYTSKNQSIYNVFVKGNAVCAGFAKASHLIFSQIGIESYIVQGTSTGEHMWNIVKYDGKYYYFDSTASVSIAENSNYHYYGLQQTNLNFYSMRHPTWYPKIESENMFDI